MKEMFGKCETWRLLCIFSNIVLHCQHMTFFFVLV